MSDPHDWNSWDHYRSIHDKRMQEQPFVLEDLLEWQPLGPPEAPRVIVLDGSIICQLGVVVSVTKTLETRVVGRGILQVRGRWYSYNAYFPGRHNILRYDNYHWDRPEEFHRHQFDLQTGQEIRMEVLRRQELPVLADFLTEVASIVGFDG